MAPRSRPRATPWFYRALGVPDTLDGRFDLIALHAFLLIHRLQDAAEPGPALAQAVFDAMFSDMDNNLREIGVSDLSVGKRMRAMWEAFHGRAKAYATAIEAADRAALEAALARNVWRGAAPDGAAASLAAVVSGTGGASCRASRLQRWHRARRNSCQRRRHAMTRNCTGQSRSTVSGSRPGRDWWKQAPRNAPHSRDRMNLPAVLALTCGFIWIGMLPTRCWRGPPDRSSGADLRRLAG